MVDERLQQAECGSFCKDVASYVGFSRQICKPMMFVARVLEVTHGSWVSIASSVVPSPYTAASVVTVRSKILSLRRRALGVVLPAHRSPVLPHKGFRHVLGSLSTLQ